MARLRRAVPKRKHKVIHERVSQQKKTLRTVLTSDLISPRDYTLIPAGNPKLTTACKEMCRQSGSPVYVVTKPADHLRRSQTSRNAQKYLLSEHVNRIGYHFPTTVVVASCEKLGITLRSINQAIEHAFLPNDHFCDPMEKFLSQDEINEKARNAIKDLFPVIPDSDLLEVIKQSFQKGGDKVGANSTLSWGRRASMAVLAHIRHKYTAYDSILRESNKRSGRNRGNYHGARSQIEPLCVDKLILWRGPDENGLPELEDVFREIIVISDDEDEFEEDEEADSQDSQVVYISSNTVVHNNPFTETSSSKTPANANKNFKRKHDSDGHFKEWVDFQRSRPGHKEWFVRGRRSELEKEYSENMDAVSPMASHTPEAFGTSTSHFDSSTAKDHQVDENPVGIQFGYVPLDGKGPISGYARVQVPSELTRQKPADSNGSTDHPHSTANAVSRNFSQWDMGISVRPADRIDSNMPVFVNGYDDLQQQDGERVASQVTRPSQGSGYYTWDRTAVPGVDLSSDMDHMPGGQFPIAVEYVVYPRPGIPAWQVPGYISADRESPLATHYANEERVTLASHATRSPHGSRYDTWDRTAGPGVDMSSGMNHMPGGQFPIAVEYVMYPRPGIPARQVPGQITVDREAPLTTHYADGYVRPVEIIPPGARIDPRRNPLNDRWFESLEPPRIRRRM
ncbi:hypothetical protein N7495_001829 [Penicillium taxi]|uniref:uncharacterized protein n=1 Tax=Penicillium taxi TaxID=168475 RepID=UPI0025452E49|nr:uncharacterized protein N7495_001829 [Penicillium taxi]KAJ5909147.1 hypothetical protein N7495_001829 [Penicillium taxi]